MKRMLTIAALVAATLAFSPSVFASTDLTIDVDNPAAMSATAGFVTDLIVEDFRAGHAVEFVAASDVCILPNGWRSPGFKADCMTPVDWKSMASEPGKPLSCGTDEVVYRNHCVPEPTP